MSYIDIGNNLPGIVGLMTYRPETAKPLNELAEILLRGDSPLTSAEREMIASYVSWKNECHFCHTSHGASAAHHLDGDLDLIDDIKAEFKKTDLSPKMRALIGIADNVRQSGLSVSQQDIDHAREQGASDVEIHDTVLIAAAFCMFNRYVDGLGTKAPEKKEEYDGMGKILAHIGYRKAIDEMS